MTETVTLTADMPIQVGSQLALRDRPGDNVVIVRSIPLDLFVDAHERQCQRSHGGQSLERIRERGGFGAMEAVAVLSCLHWGDLESIAPEHAHYILYSMIATTNRGMRLAEAAAAPERVQAPDQPAAWDIPDTVREQIRADVINSPETADFMAGVPLEAAHQRERWAAGHDAGKSPFDWFWLIGYLAQKAAASAVAGDRDKAMHHTISTAAALANWHAALAGIDTAMRPGIDPAGHQGAKQ